VEERHDLIAAAGGIVLLMVLGWAALERGRVHRRGARLRHRVRNDTANPTALVVDWRMAAGAAAGWL